MITIERQPYILSPAYNNTTTIVSSDLTNQYGFKYIFETYINDILINTTELFPRTDLKAIYDSSPIAKNYLSSYFNNDLPDYISNFTDEVIKVQIGISESLSEDLKIYFYDNCFSATTGFKIDTTNSIYFYTGQTITIQQNTGYTYNYNGLSTVLNIVNIEDNKTIILTDKIWQGSTPPEDGYLYLEYIPITEYTEEYYLYQNVANFYEGMSLSGYSLNYLPNSPLKQLLGTKNYKTTVNLSDKRILSCFRHDFINEQIKYFKILTDTGRIFKKNITQQLSLNKDNCIFHLPFGINELNAINWTTGTGYITDQDFGYTITFHNNIDTQLFRSFYVKINTCSRFDDYSVLYQSKNGSYWYVKMNKKNIKSIDISKNSIQNYILYDYNQYTQGYQTINNNGRGRITLKTDFLRNQEEVDEIIDLLSSPNIFLIKNNIITPVSISSGNYEEKNINQSKLITYEINFIESFDKNLIN